MYKKNLVCSWYTHCPDDRDPVGRVYLISFGYPDTRDLGPDRDHNADSGPNTRRSYAWSGIDHYRYR